MKWTEKRDARLKEMADAKMDWHAIAAELRVTRDAVANRARRLGIKSLAPKVRAPRKRDWTPEMDARLKEMILGKATLAEVGAAMGKTRHAISGRMTKLGIGSPLGKQKHVTRASLKRAAIRIDELRSEEIADDEECAEGVGLMDLEMFMCKWPIGGAGRHTRYCGAGTIRSYCDTHHAMAYVRIEDRSRAGSGSAHIR